MRSSEDHLCVDCTQFPPVLITSCKVVMRRHNQHAGPDQFSARLTPMSPVSLLFLIFICGAVLGLSCGMWDQGLGPGIKPGLPASGAQSLSHGTTREVLRFCLYSVCIYVLILYSFIPWIDFCIPYHRQDIEVHCHQLAS